MRIGRRLRAALILAVLCGMVDPSVLAGLFSSTGSGPVCRMSCARTSKCCCASTGDEKKPSHRHREISPVSGGQPACPADCATLSDSATYQAALEALGLTVLAGSSRPQDRSARHPGAWNRAHPPSRGPPLPS